MIKWYNQIEITNRIKFIKDVTTTYLKNYQKVNLSH